MADVEQGAGQGRGHARADDQRGDDAHEEHTGEMPPFHAIARLGETALQKAGQLQFVKAEHGKGQQHEDGGSRAQGPGVLQGIGNQGAGQPRRHTGHGVGEGHPQYIGHRQEKTLALGDARTLAHDDAGEDGDHRKNAGRQRKQEAETEETDHDQPVIATLEQRGDPTRVGAVRRVRGNDRFAGDRQRQT